MKGLSELSPRSPGRNRLLLLALDWIRPKDPPISLSQASLLANLHHHQIPVLSKAWSVNNPAFRLSDVHEFVMAHADEGTDVALGAYVWHEPYTQQLLSALKRDKFPGRIILGGPQVSYTKRGIEKYYPHANIFIRGYAEDALVRLLQAHTDKPVIAGVHYAGEPDLGLSAIANLEKLPSPFLTGLIPPRPFIRWETQRGCPFECTFCQHRESDVSMVRRQLPLSRIMQEVRWITQNPIIQDIAMLDPTFNSGPHYMTILEALIAEKCSAKLALQCRTEMIREEFLDAIERFNQTGRIVLELGLQTIHREEARIIRRSNNMKRVKLIFEELKRRNIHTEVSLIFGLPHQTLQSFKESIVFCKDYGVSTIYAYPLMLLRGTPLYDQKEQLGLAESSDLNLRIPRIQANIPHVVSSPTFTYEEWCAMAEIAESLDEYNAEQALKNQHPYMAKMSHTLRHTLWHSISKTSRSIEMPAAKERRQVSSGYK